MYTQYVKEMGSTMMIDDEYLISSLRAVEMRWVIIYRRFN